jgi:hypothetical protein
MNITEQQIKSAFDNYQFESKLIDWIEHNILKKYYCHIVVCPEISNWIDNEMEISIIKWETWYYIWNINKIIDCPCYYWQLQTQNDVTELLIHPFNLWINRYVGTQLDNSKTLIWFTYGLISMLVNLEIHPAKGILAPRAACYIVWWPPRVSAPLLWSPLQGVCGIGESSCWS